MALGRSRYRLLGHLEHRAQDGTLARGIVHVSEGAAKGALDRGDARHAHEVLNHPDQVERDRRDPRRLDPPGDPSQTDRQPSDQSGAKSR